MHYVHSEIIFGATFGTGQTQGVELGFGRDAFWRPAGEAARADPLDAIGEHLDADVGSAVAPVAMGHGVHGQLAQRHQGVDLLLDPLGADDMGACSVRAESRSSARSIMVIRSRGSGAR